MTWTETPAPPNPDIVVPVLKIRRFDITTPAGTRPNFDAALKVLKTIAKTPSEISQHEMHVHSLNEYFQPEHEGWTYYKTNTTAGVRWVFYSSGGQGEDCEGDVLSAAHYLLMRPECAKMLGATLIES